ncbi:MAG: hypothetical protein KatS3mg031_2001 [Chitinophagales bacterium]|nr:MAG: hypothetical protein KatS3mg031_2001 [Chitinophagales bacterium]
MGTLRFIYVITFLLGHIYSMFGFRYHELASSPIAYESFFMLSGFFITLVWEKEYGVAEKGYLKFLLRRILRIMPVYWLVLILSIVISFISWRLFQEPLLLQSYLQHWDDLNWNVKAYLIFANLFILGQEALFYVKIDYTSGCFQWSQQFIDGDPPLHTFLFVSQAWMISFIFYFYLIAPLLCRLKSHWLVLLSAVLIAARFIGYRMGYDYEPWVYHFYPFEFVFFLFGMLSSRIYLRYTEVFARYKKPGFVLFVFIAVLTCMLDAISLPAFTIQRAYYTLLFFTMPIILEATSGNKWDSYLGQLTYPLYISNFIVIKIIETQHIENRAVLMISFFAASILLSMFLLKYFNQPIDRYVKRWLLRPARTDRRIALFSDS